MSGQQYLASISENATRLGMRLQETLAEHTRELAIGRGSGSYLDVAAGGSGSTSGLGAGGAGDEKIRRQLDSSSDREKLDAMKKLVALISKNLPASMYFAQVVKNVASPNLEIRKLVYIYLLRYAPTSPDLALLSINSFQRDLSDSNPLIRAMSLRVLSGMRLEMVVGVVRQAIATAARDPSPYVRKAAALAIGKCYSLDPSLLSALMQILTGTMLKERSPLALGAVIVAFNALCPDRVELLHPHFRRLCRILVDMDEWGQVEAMGLLLRYARVMLVRPSEQEVGAEMLDKDLRLLLESVEPVFLSRNPAVVLAASRVFFYAAPPAMHTRFVSPLLRLLSVSPAVARVVLVDLRIIARREPKLLAPHYTRFLVRASDAVAVRKEKVGLLREVLHSAKDDEELWKGILREFVEYANDTDNSVVEEAIRAIGTIASRIPESTQQCLSALMTMLKSPHDTVVSSAVTVLKHLVQTQLSNNHTSAGTTAPLDIIAHLALRIDDIKHAQARASIVWLVGQYASSVDASSASSSFTSLPGVGLGSPPEGLAPWAADVLRKLARSFATEASLVKLQSLTLAAKLAVLSPADHRLVLLVRYVFQLARYDKDWDVRDRGRILGGLLGGVLPGGLSGANGDGVERGGVVLRREQVRVVLFEGKQTATEEAPTLLDDERVLLGSLARVTGKGIGQGIDSTLPDWLERGVESVLRDAEDEAAQPAALTAISSASAQQSRIVGMGNNGSGSAQGRQLHQNQRGGGASPAIVLTPTGATTPTGAQKGAFIDLDSFYADAEEAEEEESEEEEEEEGSEEEGEDDEEEEEEEESEDDGGGDGHKHNSGESDAGQSSHSRTSSGSRASPAGDHLAHDIEA
ncbi:hypothetical protein D9619_004173 [Psilocybe cf. subviscida]|uniref:Clathrin/coatomer adaptor adaptin-like N-terminal domain-containing protein n=1 Tax=Psilocybe cf. subviscida TaxID=2480587 RepID=A0A8H5BQ92_9AGAR|nr:hypothetical protein D9619_004173 [Psilocybe cf. subviscida]